MNQAPLATELLEIAGRLASIAKLMEGKPKSETNEASVYKRPDGKFTEAGVAELNRLFRETKMTNAEIARFFNTSDGAIGWRRRML